MGLLVAYLLMMGVLSGILGERVQRAREELERTARELDRVRVDNDVILRHLTTGVLTVDGRARVAYLNPAAEQFLGLRALECRAHALDEALPERLRPLRDLISETLVQRAPRARAELSAIMGKPVHLYLHVKVKPGADLNVAALSALIDVAYTDMKSRLT